MPLSDNYITTNLLSAINSNVVTSLKTAYNYTTIVVETSSTSIPIPDSDPIEIPLYEEERVQQYSYTNVDAYSGAPGFDVAVTSAYPEASVMSAYNEDDEVLNVSAIATQECMIYAMANGIIKQLITDNKLLYNPDTTVPFKWYVQNETRQSVTFDPDDDYPYWCQDSTLVPVTDNVLNLSLASISVLKESTDISSSLIKVLASDGSHLRLEKYVAIDIDEDVDVDSIVGINILATVDEIFGIDSVDDKKYNINDYYIQDNNVFVKFKTDYDDSNQLVFFNVTLQYLYN